MRTQRVMLAVAVIAMANSAGIGVSAQPPNACPANLQALDSQVATPSLRVGLTVAFDDVIAAAGGLNQALANTRALLDQVSSRRESMPEEASPAALQPLDEAILVLSTTIEALECRQEQGS